MKKLCKIEFDGANKYEFVADTYVSFHKDNTIFLVVDETTKTWKFLRPDLTVSVELGARIDQMISKYFNDFMEYEKVRLENNDEWDKQHNPDKNTTLCAPSDPICSCKKPWHAYVFGDVFYAGTCLPFVIIGAVTFSVVGLGWLLKLIHVCL